MGGTNVISVIMSRARDPPPSEAKRTADSEAHGT